jgi:catechol 2,3-dioxygenase-like lactoylglutathione lyase family enzyme
MTIRPIVKGVRHVGIYAMSPASVAQFYQEMLGLVLVQRGGGIDPDRVCDTFFLGNNSAEEPYQLAIYANPEIQYIAFEVAALGDLQTLYQLAVDRGLTIRWALNHGNALAFYVYDPAGNLLKLFWSTGVVFPLPHGHPIDLSQSEVVLRQDVAALAAQLK